MREAFADWFVDTAWPAIKEWLRFMGLMIMLVFSIFLLVGMFVGVLMLCGVDLNTHTRVEIINPPQCECPK